MAEAAAASALGDPRPRCMPRHAVLDRHPTEGTVLAGEVAVARQPRGRSPVAMTFRPKADPIPPTWSPEIGLVMRGGNSAPAPSGAWRFGWAMMRARHLCRVQCLRRHYAQRAGVS